MSLYMLSSKGYSPVDSDYGDCTVIIHNGKAFVYDCGSEEHAKRVEELLSKHNISNAIAVLSHNDDDHYLGFKYLIDKGLIDCLITVDIIKHKQDILDKIDDGRKTYKSVGEQIEELYDNITDLKERITVYDIFESSSLLPSFVSFTGPDYDYMIDAAAQGCNTMVGDVIDNTSFTNASSIQLTVEIGNNKILLTGDCAPEAINNKVNLRTYTHIQLPHHGNAEEADKIFERIDKNGFNNKIVYLVSDNKGNAVGGSATLKTKGRNINNSKYGDIIVKDDYKPESIMIQDKRLSI